MKIDGYLTTAQAAEILGVSLGRVRQLIANGTIKSEKLGNTRLMLKAEVDKYLSNRGGAGWPKGKPRKQAKE